jgi:hypothetical protein
MSSRWQAAVAAVVAAGVAVATAGAASADNSNSNTNNNDVTQPASLDGFGASSGATEKTNWPPTDLSWPPTEVMNGGVGESGNKKGNETESSSTTPIVIPAGQTASTTGTEEAPKPIVPVNTP